MKNIYFALFLLCPLQIISQYTALSQNSIISGIVTEAKSGESLIGITVALYSDSNIAGKIPIRGTYTNKFGFYSIPNIQPGKYELYVSGVGYNTFHKSIDIKNGNKINLDINLYQIDINLNTVTVEENRPENMLNTLNTIKINPEFIAKMPALGGEKDIFRTLQLLPGVKQTNEFSSGLYIRGGTPDQNLILLDGVVVYNPIHLGGFLSTFNSDALKDVRLLKGAFPAEYGGRLSSVLDMTMREGTQE